MTSRLHSIPTYLFNYVLDMKRRRTKLDRKKFSVHTHKGEASNKDEAWRHIVSREQ